MAKLPEQEYDVFDATIPHRSPELPKEVLEEEDRIIIAMDYIYD